MSLHIFTGPSLDTKTILSVMPESIIHAPVARDDLFKIPFITGDQVLIIDGYFESKPSVAHFEIIEIIENGVSVFGASSMGALRAAELADVGMIGIGLIFEMYFSGLIDGDDEVAMLHSEDYIPLTMPMIDLRIILQKLSAREKIKQETSNKIIQDVGQYAYQERTMTLIKKIIAAHADSNEQRIIFLNFTLENSQKRADALYALRFLKQLSTKEKLSLPKTCFRVAGKKHALKV